LNSFTVFLAIKSIFASVPVNEISEWTTSATSVAGTVLPEATAGSDCSVRAGPLATASAPRVLQPTAASNSQTMIAESTIFIANLPHYQASNRMLLGRLDSLHDLPQGFGNESF
jgi:hypothetical protein